VISLKSMQKASASIAIMNIDELMQDTQGCIYLPNQLQEQAVIWYHKMLIMHPGETCMELTIAYHYTWKGNVQDNPMGMFIL
jgi:hypothetical protein